jgi:hypothetical protein
MKATVKSVLWGVVLSISLVVAPLTVRPRSDGSRPVDSSAVSANDQSQLLALAKALIAAQHELRVRGIAEKERIVKGLALGTRELLNQRISEIVSEQKSMRANHQTYTDFAFELTPLDLEVNGRTAKLTAVERTKLRLSVAGDSLAPDATEFVQDHEFTFVQREGIWDIVSDRLINEPGPAQRKADEDDTPPINLPPTQVSPNNTNNGEVIRHHSTFSRSFLPALVSLNRTAIVNYATTYWSNYNPNYRRFDGSSDGGDCTNFVSQACRAGGWTDVSGWYTSTLVWWYTWANQSYTWTSAHSWFWFTYNRPRGTLASYISNLVPGDILQIDFNRDGRIDHSMVVTRKDSYGNIYLTYHSTNWLNRSFSSIYSSYPTANYYGWRLYSYPN